MRDGDGDLLIGDEVFQLDLSCFVEDLGAALVAIVLADLFQLFDDDAAQLLFRGEDGFVFGDALAHAVQLAGDLVDGKPRQAVQLQFEDGVGLQGREGLLELHLLGGDCFQVDVDGLAGEVGDQIVACFGAVLAAANDGNHRVEVIERGDVAFQNVLALAGPRQQVGSAAAHHFHAVIDEVLDSGDQAKLARLVVDHRQEDHAERFLHGGVLVQLVQDDLRLGAALELDDDAHAVAIAFVAHIADVADGLIEHQLGDALDQGGLVHLIRDLGDDDGLAIFTAAFQSRFGAHDEAAAAVLISVEDALLAVDVGAGGEVGAFDMLQDLQQAGAGIVHQGDAGIHNLREIVRRNICRHADGDAVRAIDQQVGNAGGQHGGLFRAGVVVIDEIDGVFINIGKQLFRHAGHTALGVPHRRRRVAIDRAEVTLAIDQRIAHGEGLRHTHQRVIERFGIVRMQLAQGLADDFGALDVLAVVQNAHLVHRIKSAAMNGLEAVAHVGQGAADDDGESVVEVRPAHLLFNVDGNHVGGAGTLRAVRRKRELLIGVLGVVCHKILSL